MKRRSKCLSLVGRMSLPGATQALIDALSHAHPEESGELAIALLRRPTRAGCAALIRHYHSFSEEVREKIARSAGNFQDSLTRLIYGDQSQTRRNALELVRRRLEIAVLEALPAVLERRDAAEQALAAAALLGLTRGCAILAMSGGTEDDARLLERFDHVIYRAIDSYPQHRQQDVLIAAAILSCKPGAKLSAWFDNREHPTHFAFRAALRHLDENERARSLLTWLSIDTVANQAIELVEKDARRPDLLRQILREAHLALLPTVAGRLARLNAAAPAVIDRTDVEQLDDDSQERLPAWLAAINLDDDERARRLGDGVNFRSPLARLEALRRLMRMNDPAADAEIASFTFDAEERICRIAAGHCIRRRVDGLPALLRRLERSPHPSLRRLAESRRVVAEFDWLWLRWAREAPDPKSMPSAQTLTAGHELLKRDQDQFIAQLRDRLRSRERGVLLHAIRIAVALGVAATVELELLALTRVEDGRVVATAMRALGTLGTDSARQAVDVGTQSDEQRVGANAIEMLTPDELRSIRPRLESLTSPESDNRVRANAIRALASIDRPAAIERLDSMLLDRRPLHRVSALWATERLNGVEVARTVARLAQEDPRPALRQRAARVARRLLGLLQADRMRERQQQQQQQQQQPSPARGEQRTKSQPAPTAHGDAA